MSIVNPGHHWQFAAATAFARIGGLTRSFDFEREVVRANYVGITPGYIVEIIDGFLDEPDGVIFQGNRRDLVECRKLLISSIQAAFDSGLTAGDAAFRNSGDLRDCWKSNQLHDLAGKAAPDERSIRGWFMEGFCYGWTSAGMEYVAESIEKEHGG
jgi:hypothetical protein